MSALLACASRGLVRLVVGVPCGERQPSAWLATIAEQAGWDIEKLRAAPDAEAVAGAPLGPADSLGAHEVALWDRPARQPSLTFRVPPCPPAELGLRASGLDLALGDTFALVCQRFALGPLLQDRRLMEDGNALHDLLKHLAVLPPPQWPVGFETLAAAWTEADAEPLAQAARRQRLPRLRQVVAAEADHAAGAAVAAEVALTIPLDLGEQGRLALRGRADRLDRHGDGTVSVIDYKRGGAQSHRAKVADGREAQVLAYIQALRAMGERVREGVFVPLADGKRVAVDLEGAAERWAEVCRALAELAAGTAVARRDGACPPAVIRAAEYAEPSATGEDA
jgi:RecB family exonuclease